MFFRINSREAEQGGGRIMSLEAEIPKFQTQAQTYQLRVSGGIPQNFLEPPFPYL